MTPYRRFIGPIVFLSKLMPFFSYMNYGDPRYDVAKLLHSVHGAYDFILYDLFRVHWTTDMDVSYEIFAGPHLTEVRRAFDQVFCSRFDAREIDLLEGLLFVTMGVFHEDRPDRQIVMLCSGIRMLNETLA